MKVITNPISNIPKLANSHVRGWSQVWAEQLDATIDHRCSDSVVNSDILYIEHGVNFGGTLNLFGGATQEVFDKINRAMAAKKVVSLDIDMPDWGEQLRKRINANTTYVGIDDAWCDKLSKWCKSIDKFCQEDLTGTDGITIGDSHSTSFSRYEDKVFRTNGKTLFGTLRKGLENEFRGTVPSGTITFSLGSIDIRHHIMRHADSNRFSIDELVKEYVRQGKDIESKHKVDVYFSAPVPVEYEARKLPKSGYYKGTPFFGSREERLDLTLRFIELLNKYSGNVVQPPEFWYTMDGEKYAKTYMEANSSVHISPEYYRRYNWGNPSELTPLESLFS
jgi:hypothetical protein